MKSWTFIRIWCAMKGGPPLYNATLRYCLFHHRKLTQVAALRPQHLGLQRMRSACTSLQWVDYFSTSNYALNSKIASGNSRLKRLPWTHVSAMNRIILGSHSGSCGPIYVRVPQLLILRGFAGLCENSRLLATSEAVFRDEFAGNLKILENHPTNLNQQVHLQLWFIDLNTQLHVWVQSRRTSSLVQNHTKLYFYTSLLNLVFFVFRNYAPVWMQAIGKKHGWLAISCFSNLFMFSQLCFAMSWSFWSPAKT